MRKWSCVAVIISVTSALALQCSSSDQRTGGETSRSKTFFSAALRSYVAGHPDELIPASLFFELQWPDGLGERLHDRDEVVRSVAQNDLRAAVGHDAEELKGELRGRGIEVVAIGEGFPAIFIQATAAQLSALDGHARLSSIRLNLPGHGMVNDVPISGPPNSMSTIKVDTGFNAHGFFGAFQGIGFTEGGQCAIYDRHQAFAHNSPGQPRRFIYDGPINPCDPINYKTQCASCSLAGANGTDFLCLGGECVAVHASKAASSAAASTNAEYGAAEANLYFGNAGTGNGIVACNDQAIIHEYNTFAAEGVTTANESWSCNNDGDPTIEKDSDGPIQDWFARHFQITIVRSAGNVSGGPPYNHACPFMHNAICVGSYNAGMGAVDPGSSWVNPRDFPNHDREEPDVVALGAGVQDVGITTAEYPATNLWGVDDGTSQAAPAVAALVALMKQACSKPLQHGSMIEAQARARIKTGAYLLAPSLGYHTTVPLCPPGNTGCDGTGGAGLVNSNALLDFCGIPTTGNTPFSYTHSVVPGSRTVQNTEPLPSGKYGALPNGDLVHLGVLSAGETVRATVSWDTCVINQDKANESVMDFDLFLFNNTTGHYNSTFSATFDDNNEGFQINNLPGGDYSLMVSFPVSAVPCPGFSTEPYYLEAVHGTHF